MANLFNDLKPKANPTKNGFDLSERHTYTARAGMCYPVMTKEVIPGDYFEIDTAALARTQTLVAPSFARVKQYHHFFFVPYNALWHNWDEFYTQRVDPTMANQKVPLYVPTVDFAKLADDWANSGNTQYSHSNVDVDNLARVITDMLGYGDIQENTIMYGALKGTDKYRMNVFRLLAYHKIWQDYYRNAYRDNGLDPKQFNVDDIPCDTLANSYLENYRTTQEMLDLIKPMFRGWKKDLFMGSMPTMQFGNVSVLNTSFNLSLNITGNPNVGSAAKLGVDGVFNTHGIIVRKQDDTVVSNTQNTVFNSNLFDVLSLRKAEKLQEWKQKTLLAGNRMSSQYIAHLGETPWRENDHANFIGGFEGTVQINEVTQTTGHSSSGSNNSLGDLAGKGVGATTGKTIKFKAKDFGVIMCIVSFVPELEYNGNYTDKANTLYEQFDFFTPEFENIGLEPVTRRQLTNKSVLQSGTADQFIAEANAVYGYVPRYSMYKTSVDRCHGNLASYGSMSYYSTPRSELIAPTTLYTANFYISPSVLNSIFGVAIDSEIESDQFICVSNFDVKAIRPISKIGIPSF